ncbi:flowering-promoting factor 1-like [Magnolia sinica]|uniref:flowering-promoting factor 1-like n=1 Tax=Magnolia sinica TaxID=86752 RepID=UPI00265851A8|nr:flowering-promoting factor 1-like [Magnolia sinica]
MSGVWVFKNGVARLISNPSKERLELPDSTGQARRRVLVHVASNQVISSYAELEQRLVELGWEHYETEAGKRANLIQFHRSSASAHLISLPKNFKNFNSTHMYDIVVKNRSHFVVREHPA